jgi:hypothetical protein
MCRYVYALPSHGISHAYLKYIADDRHSTEWIIG